MSESFEWDDVKAQKNFAKHRLEFDDAIKVFADPEVIVVSTFRQRDLEKRFKAIGRIGDRIFTVVYTKRTGARRIISARRANAAEEKHYGNRSPRA